MDTEGVMTNVYRLNQSARNHALLIERLADAMQMASDDPAIRDTAEGESELPELAAWALRERRVLLAEADGIEAVIADLERRIARKLEAADKIKDAVAEALHEAGYGTGKKALRLPDMTISVSLKAKRHIDADALPDEFKREVVSIKPDMDKLNAAIEAGQTFIPGVTFGNAAPSITVRTK
jgi:hypothetical protein